MNLTEKLKLAYIQNQDFLLTAIQADKMLLKKETTMEEIIPALHSIDGQGLKNVFLSKRNYLAIIRKENDLIAPSIRRKLTTFIFLSKEFIEAGLLYFLEKRNFEILNSFFKLLSSQYTSLNEELVHMPNKIIDFLNTVILNDPGKPISKTQFKYAMKALTTLLSIEYKCTRYHTSSAQFYPEGFPSFKLFIENNMCLKVAEICTNNSYIEEDLGFPKNYFIEKVGELGTLTDVIKLCLNSYKYDDDFIIEKIKACRFDKEVREAINFIFEKQTIYNNNIPVLIQLLTIYVSANGDIAKLAKHSTLKEKVATVLLQFADAVNVSKTIKEIK